TTDRDVHRRRDRIGIPEGCDMSKKTLPDELRSVLLAHSLDAPEPDNTVEQILAATVGTAAASSTASISSPASPSRRWWTSNQLLGAAVVVALLVLGVGA